jgi:hypothetical protein
MRRATLDMSREGVGCAMVFKNLEAAWRQLGLEQLGHAGAEQAILMDDDDGLCSLAGGIVELDEVLDARST